MTARTEHGTPAPGGGARGGAPAGRALSDAATAAFAGGMAALWTALVGAELGRFHAFPALAAGLLAGYAAWRGARRAGAAEPPPDARPWHRAAAAGLALATLALTTPPGESILGGWDPGVYLHTAGTLAREGTLAPAFPEATELGAGDRAWIGRQGRAAWEPFAGMRLMPDGRLSPQFLHLYPTLQALAWPLGGVRAALWVNPVLNVLAVFAFFLAARRWVGPYAALAGTALLALNPAQVWQARFGTAELLTQALLLGGLALAGRAFAGGAGRRLDAALAGAAFGLALLTRLDAVLFLAPLALVLLAGIRARAQRGAVLLLLCACGLLALHAGWHYARFAPFYRPAWTLVAGGVRAAAIAASLAFGAWVFLSWYVRPRLSVDGRVLRLVTGLFPGLADGRWFPLLAGRHARNFWYLESLFGVAGLALSLIGVAVLFFRSGAGWKKAWLAGGLCALAVLMLHNFHEPFMMFAARRLVPAVVPLLCLGAAAAADAVAARRPRAAAAAAVFAAALVLIPTARATAATARLRDWPGLVAWYERLAPALPPDALVFSDQPGFAAPLRFLYGVRALELRPERGTTAEAAAWLLERARHGTVLWLTARGPPEELRGQFEVLGEYPLESSTPGSARHRVPRHALPRSAAFRLYRAAPAPATGP